MTLPPLDIDAAITRNMLATMGLQIFPQQGMSQQRELAGMHCCAGWIGWTLSAPPSRACLIIARASWQAHLPHGDCEDRLFALLIDEEMRLEEQLELAILKEELWSALRDMPEREAYILRQRFGLNEEHRAYTLQALAENWA